MAAEKAATEAVAIGLRQSRDVCRMVEGSYCMVMHIKSIASHLRPYVMLARRRTTINHAFAAAIAPTDTYDLARVAEAMSVLGFDSAEDLPCAYCGALAETWDHVYATVKGSQFSGHGHRLGNLLPCCKPCNSKKGNRPWDMYLSTLPIGETERASRSNAIAKYLERYSKIDVLAENSADHERLAEIRRQVLALLGEGDAIAARIRATTGL